MGFVDTWLQECKGYFFEVGWDGQCFSAMVKKIMNVFVKELLKGLQVVGPGPYPNMTHRPETSEGQVSR